MGEQQKDLDFVIFGATGFTGKLVVEEFYRAAQYYQNSFPNAPKFTWAIAGRSEKKLFKMANIISITTSSSSVRQPEMIIADVTRPETLDVMAKRAKVLIACVGPFRLYGEPVVKACLENHTDYVDITGETEFIEQIQIKYHELAKTSNVTIVPACGFDCLPADYGLLYTKQQMEGINALPSSVELFYHFTTGPSGTTLHYATYESAVLSIQHIDDLRKLRASVTRLRVPKIGPELKKIPNGRWEKRVNGYVTPFFFADPAVIRLSQQLDIEHKSDVQPVQFSAYLVIPKLKYLLELLICYKVASFLAHYSWGRWLLLKFPRVFSLGFFSQEGPTLEQIQQTKFEISFYARGYSKELIETIVTQVAGPEPGYVTTPISVVQCAFTLLLEKTKIPAGVLTCSVAFGKTELLKRLMKNGLDFKIPHVRT
ncbi:7227_t:CDS:2 [Ambispora leptoticha]|uniref:7227_t:CDS:1 n=1 Tax=Ambispora leptoticha TaxID=144679 RepID=A0A9N9AGG1_9GLOM|nr:7227_t:CDS:2 [Ambispora leptoticha]